MDRIQGDLCPAVDTWGCSLLFFLLKNRLLFFFELQNTSHPLINIHFIFLYSDLSSLFSGILLPDLEEVYPTIFNILDSIQRFLSKVGPSSYSQRCSSPCQTINLSSQASTWRPMYFLDIFRVYVRNNSPSLFYHLCLHQTGKGVKQLASFLSW